MRDRQHTAALWQHGDPERRPEGDIAGTIDGSRGFIEEQRRWPVDEGSGQRK
jgi:hypothetical protein